MPTKEMGKNFQNQDSSISLDHHHPGCMRGIFNHFQHQRWHQVRKRLPHRRHGIRKPDAVVGDSGSTKTTKGSEVSEIMNSEAETSPTKAKPLGPATVRKSSMKSRIKALIAEEMSKRRGRHRRSSSYPARLQLERIVSIHHLEVSDLGPPYDISSRDDTIMLQDSLHSSAASLLDPVLPKLHEVSITGNRHRDYRAALLTVNYLKQTEIMRLGLQPMKDHTLSPHKLIYAIEPTRNASLEESKLFLDALDLLNIRKELFLKILQDPSSSLADQLHDRAKSNLRSRLSRSLSFPMAGSEETIFRTKCITSKEDNASSLEGEDKLEIGPQLHFNGSESTQMNMDLRTCTACLDVAHPNHVLMGPEPFDVASLGSPPTRKNRHDSKPVIKHFKNLREKIKHVIRDSRRERRRIVMDGVLHKVPHGHKSSKDIKEEDNKDKKSVLNKELIPEIGSGGAPIMCSFDKDEAKCFRRASSFGESLSKYRRLLESSYSTEVKQHNSQKSDVKLAGFSSPAGRSPITLSRIHSLPDLRYYSSSRIEGSPSGSATGTPSMSAADNISSRDTTVTEQKHSEPPETSKIQTPIVDKLDTEMHGICMDVRENFDDSSDKSTEEGASFLNHNVIPAAGPASMLDGPSPVSTPDANCQDVTTGPLIHPTTEDDAPADGQRMARQDYPDAVQNSFGDNEVDSSTERAYYQLLMQVDEKSKLVFNYVRNVLELSGFSGRELLGAWHSTDQPVNPSVHEEIEGCWLAQPDSGGNEEICVSDHLLLFDLINEVLLEIYERSFSYWQRPLTCHSHIHTMPKGHHVLIEVWTDIKWYLNGALELNQVLDDAVNRDLNKGNSWMNLQSDAEGVGLELENLIFDDLLEELISH